MKTKSDSAGFTLIEVLIVVVILGILAAIVVPGYSGFSGDAEKNAFLADVRSFIGSAEYYRTKTGELLADAASGTVPAGWEPYIEARKWTRITPIGGLWDVEQNSYGVQSAFGVHFMAGQGRIRDDAYMQELDATIDDGDLNTGQFRKIDSDRYYVILAE